MSPTVAAVSFVRSMAVLGLGFALLVGCGSNTPPPSPLASADTDAHGGPFPSRPGGSTNLPAGCRTPEEDVAAQETGSEFRFDVGAAADAPAFPFDCEDAVAQASNLGCEFWAVDLPNDGRGTPMSPPAADQQFAVVVANPSGLVDAVVEVWVGSDDRLVADTSVPPGEARTIPLPSASIEPYESSVADRAYRITSTLPITAYQFNPLDNTVQVYSNDASLLFPTEALGTQYMAFTADAVLLGAGFMDPTPASAGAFVSVVATQDDTRIEVQATSALVAPPALPSVLDRGHVLTVVSSATDPGGGNLSGTRISADRPVAVFSGNVAAAIPNDGWSCCADHVEHQLAPLTAWGNAYAVAPPPSPQGAPHGDDPAEYRLIGAFDGTDLLYCPSAPPGAPTSIDAAEVVTFTTDRPFTVRSADRERTFGLAQFLLSHQAIDPEQFGDPSFLLVPPSAQFQTRYLFVTPSGYATQVVTLLRSGAAEVRLDGEVVAETLWRPLGVLGVQPFTYAHVPVEEGAHLVESRAALGLSVFGYDEAVSFAFPGGAGARVIAIPPVAG